MVQVQVLTPLNSLAHKPRSSSFHCSPLTRRRTLPSPRELSFSQIKYQNAVERAAVRKLTAQLLASPSILALKPTAKSTVLAVSTPSFVPASVSSAEDSQIQTPPATPPTPLEVEDILPAPEPKSKVDIFKNTTKSSELLDLILAALDRIYIQDFCQDSSSLFHPEPQPMIDAVRSGFGRTFSQYEHSPPSSCGSSVSSASSTPSAIPTPRSMSPEIVPEIASPSGTTSAAVDYSKTGLKPVGRTQSLPGYTHPVLEDKSSLRWFLTELLRRSRASASVVQLALHYLTQARVPVGKILVRRFKSEPEVRARFAGEDDKDSMKEADSPLLDPRRLLLASLMLSTKILHDHAPNNRAWARVCGLDAIEVGKCERALGQALNWELAHMFVGPVNKPLFE